MRTRSLLGLFAAVLAAVVLTVPPAHAENIGHQGCTPGYWKTHTDNWEETNPNVLFGTLFTSARANVAGDTLLEALQGQGGPGLDGAAEILARAATAAWLNAAHEGVGYPWRRFNTGLDGRPPLVETVNAAFESNSRSVMLALASLLDQDNNLGCTLN